MMTKAHLVTAVYGLAMDLYRRKRHATMQLAELSEGHVQETERISRRLGPFLLMFPLAVRGLDPSNTVEYLGVDLLVTVAYCMNGCFGEKG